MVMQQPQHLVGLMQLLGFSGCLNSWSIVPSNLLISETMRPGSDMVSITVESSGHKASGEVGSDRRQHNEGLGFLDCAQTQLIVHTD